MRAIHRIVGIVVAAQIAIWIATGLLFNVKYRYDEAYETLRPARAPIVPGQPWVSPDAAIAASGGDPSAIERVLLVHDNRGPVYVVWGAQLPHLLVDARTGARLTALDAAGAEAVLRSALASSPHAARYGRVEGVSRGRAFSPLLGEEAPAWELSLDTGQTVTINELTAEIAHTSLLNTWIDWTYRFHYMQYTPWKSVNVAIVVLFSVLVFGLLTTGVRMFFERARRYGYDRRRIRF